MRNRFVHPNNAADFLEWGHETEDATEKLRQVERTANTAGVRLVRQQGDDGPLIFRYTGTIMRRADYRKFWYFFMLSRTQTIYFRDFDGNEYEVQIIAFRPTRTRTLRNMRDSSIPHHYWKFAIEIEVLRVISGDLLGLEA